MFDSLQHLMSFWYIFLEIYLDDIIWWDLVLISYFEVEVEEVLGSKHMILLTSLFIELLKSNFFLRWFTFLPLEKTGEECEYISISHLSSPSGLMDIQEVHSHSQSPLPWSVFALFLIYFASHFRLLVWWGYGITHPLCAPPFFFLCPLLMSWPFCPHLETFPSHWNFFQRKRL